MLDSDGFEVTQMEADDFESLTLEEKILCGYYTAKPYMKDAYPIAQMNIPNSKNYWKVSYFSLQNYKISIYSLIFYF